MYEYQHMQYHILYGEIKRFIRDDGPIKVSRSIKELATKINEIQRQNINKTGEELKVNELAAKLNVSKEEIVEALDAIRRPESIDEELYDEAGQTKSAVKYYKESMKIDTLMKNYNGLFNSAMHMAEINSSIDTNVSLEFLNKALEYAKVLNEPFYIVRANIEIGDFYMLRKDLEQAYKYFISAYDVAKHSFSKDNLDKVSARIENLKLRVNEEDFKILQERYGK